MSALSELVGKWRSQDMSPTNIAAAAAIEKCADELEAALRAVEGEAVPFGWLEPETENFINHATKLAMPEDAATFTTPLYTHPQQGARKERGSAV